MANMNKVFLIGNLTRDPELRHTAGGNPVANLRLAVNRFYKAKDGEVKKEPSFFNITAWGRQGEICGEYLKKGSPILVEGRLHSSNWVASDGQKRTSVEVVALRINFLEKKGASATTTAFEEEVAPQEPGNGEAIPEEENPDEVAVAGKPSDDSIPF